MSAAPAAATGTTPRLAYLDWLRGLAVLIMIEAHTLDAWTAAPDRTSTAFGLGIVLGGMGAPLFLFLAGISVALAAGSRSARVGERAAAQSVRRRGWQIFGYAFLFRLWAWALNPGASLRALLKVDILNIMGPSIVGAAALWALGRTALARAAWLGAATVLVAMVTPLVRTTALFEPLPDAIETYLRPEKGLATFTLFPWGAFVTAGAVCGVAIHRAGRERGARVAAACLVVGAALGALGYFLSFKPSIYAESHFWTTSPAFFCLRAGVLTATVALAWAWSARPWRRGPGPLEVLGASSLFVYWIHVEMVYGVFATPLRRALALPQVAVAFALFTLLLFGLTLLKLRIVAAWKRNRVRAGSGESSAQ